MPQLTLLVGPAGSGKSTLAKQLIANTPDIEGEAVYINQDSQGKEHLALYDDALLAGKSIVVDRMNFNKSQRNRYLDLAKARGYRTKIVVLHVPYYVCFERCMSRKDHQTIKDEVNARAALATFFSKYERVSDDEADVVERLGWEGYKPPAVICDLDGTLCDIRHRLHYVRRPEGEKKDWKGFFDEMNGDAVNQWCADILTAVSDEVAIVFCSGRPDNHRSATVGWLKRNRMYELNEGNYGVPDSPYGDKFHLYMRPRGDQRDDSIIKEIILDFEILTRFTPHFMIDDRKRVVDMWRSRGYTCLACAEGNF